MPEFTIINHGKELVREFRSKRQVARSKTADRVSAAFQITLVAIALFLLLGVIFAHADTSFNQNLYYGITNSQDVQALQEFLTVQGDYTGPVSGNFFSLTLQGVKNFQTANNLPITGYFGVLSRDVANSTLASTISAPPQSEVGSTTVANTTGAVSSTSVQTSYTQTSLCPIFTTPSGAIVNCNGVVLFTPQQTQTIQSSGEAQVVATSSSAAPVVVPPSTGVPYLPPTQYVPPTPPTPSCTLSGTVNNSGIVTLSWTANVEPTVISNTLFPSGFIGGDVISAQTGSITNAPLSFPPGYFSPTLKISTTTTYTMYLGSTSFTTNNQTTPPEAINSTANCVTTIQF